MKVEFGPRNILMIDDANIKWPNFEGRGDGMYNREGERNFLLSFDNPDLVDELVDRGWNVRIKEFEDGDPLMTMKVKVRFDNYPPEVWLHTNGIPNRLDESTIGMLDTIDIERIDMDISGSNWSMKDGRSGRTAYLKTMHVTQKLDRFAERYNIGRRNNDDDYDVPFDM